MAYPALSRSSSRSSRMTTRPPLSPATSTRASARVRTILVVYRPPARLSVRTTAGGGVSSEWKSAASASSVNSSSVRLMGAHSTRPPTTGGSSVPPSSLGAKVWISITRGRSVVRLSRSSTGGAPRAGRSVSHAVKTTMAFRRRACVSREVIDEPRMIAQAPTHRSHGGKWRRDGVGSSSGVEEWGGAAPPGGGNPGASGAARGSNARHPDTQRPCPGLRRNRGVQFSISSCGPGEPETLRRRHALSQEINRERFRRVTRRGRAESVLGRERTRFAAARRRAVLRARDGARFDLLSVDDGGLFVDLLHATLLLFDLGR